MAVAVRADKIGSAMPGAPDVASGSELAEEVARRARAAYRIAPLHIAAYAVSGVEESVLAPEKGTLTELAGERVADATRTAVDMRRDRTRARIGELAA